MTVFDYTLTMLSRAAEEGFPWSVSPAEAAALVAEVERLRAEVGMLQQEARIRKNLCDGLASEAAEERAAVVAWLRTQRLYCTDSTGAPNAVSATYAHAAEAIERGEHRREEE